MRVFLCPLVMMGALLGCNTNPDSRDYPNPTLLEVVSSYFEGAPRCAEPEAGAGGYARYVATLVELERDAEGDITATPVAVAPPTRCGRDVLFASTTDRPLRTDDSFRYYARVELFAHDDVELRGSSRPSDSETPRVVRDGRSVSPTHVGVCGTLDLPLLDFRASAAPFSPFEERFTSFSLVGTDDGGIPSDAATEPPGDAATEPPGDAATEPPGDAATEPPADAATEPSDAAANGPSGGPDAVADSGAERLDTRPERAWEWSVRARERRTVAFGQCVFVPTR